VYRHPMLWVTIYFDDVLGTGERHEVAKRRRDEMNRCRSLALAMRTGYPPTFASPATKRPATSAVSTTVIPVMVRMAVGGVSACSLLVSD
jgi:hypothetical protein